MKRLSILISDIYNKYLPLSNDRHIELNLGVIDSDSEVVDVEEVQAHLDEQLQNLLKKSRNHGAISLGIENGNIVIHDNETVLSPLVCAGLSCGRVEVKSRVGFGTTIHISAKEQQADDNDNKRDKKALEPGSETRIDAKQK